MHAYIHIYHRLELAFWDMFIQTLTENQRLRGVIRIVSSELRAVDFPAFTRQLAVSALVGLIGGVSLFFLSLYAR